MISMALGRYSSGGRLEARMKREQLLPRKAVRIMSRNEAGQAVFFTNILIIIVDENL